MGDLGVLPSPTERDVLVVMLLFFGAGDAVALADGPTGNLITSAILHFELHDFSLQRPREPER